MNQNIIEKLREEAVKSLFDAKGFASAWPTSIHLPQLKAHLNSLI